MNIKTKTGIASLVGIMLLSACSGDSSSSSPGTNDSNDSNNGTDTRDITSESARYRLRFIGQWNTTTFSPVPGSAHFTGLIGATVNDQATLWRSGELASPAFEQVAELGINGNFRNQINDAINANQAQTLVEGGSNTPTGTVTVEFTVNRSFPRVTFATMVAPSPDWFVGVNQFELMNANGEWRESITHQLPVYDGGTESGNVFSLNNAATVPAEPIQRLTELAAGQINFVNGLVDGKAIARFEFERIQ